MWKWTEEIIEKVWLSHDCRQQQRSEPDNRGVNCCVRQCRRLHNSPSCQVCPPTDEWVDRDWHDPNNNWLLFKTQNTDGY